MIADLALVLLLCLPVVALGFATGVRFETGVLGVLVFVIMGGAVGPGVHRLPLCDRAEDRQPGGGQHQLHPLLSLRLPHLHLRPRGGADRLAVHHRRLQPGHLPARGVAVAGDRGLGRRGAGQGDGGDPGGGRRQPDPGAAGLAGPASNAAEQAPRAGPAVRLRPGRDRCRVREAWRPGGLPVRPRRWLGLAMSVCRVARAASAAAPWGNERPSA